MNADLFEIHPAPVAVAPFVRRFVYANQPLTQPVLMQVKPNGYAFSANFFARRARATRITVDGVTRERSSRWMLAGQIVHQSIQVEELDHFGVVYMELAATAPFRLFGLDGPAQAGRAQPLPDVVLAVAREVFRPTNPRPAIPIWLRPSGSSTNWAHRRLSTMPSSGLPWHCSRRPMAPSA